MVMRATDIVKTFLDTNPQIELPKKDEIMPIKERLKQICKHFQDEKILDILPLPDPKKFSDRPQQLKKILDSWEKHHKELLKRGIGREILVEQLLDYKRPEKIIKEIERLHMINPKKAGEYAHKYIGLNPLTAWQSKKVSELTETVIIPETKHRISYRYDSLLDLYGVYEFKITTKKNLDARLREALIQSYLYDFILKLKFKEETGEEIDHTPILIEIYLVDTKEILRFGLSNKNLIFPDKEILKRLFRVNQFENMDVIEKLIEQLYTLQIYSTPESKRANQRYWKFLDLRYFIFQ